MNALMVFLGLVTQPLAEGADDTLRFDVVVEQRLHAALVSLDPLVRLRAAWLLPEFVVRGETLSFAGSRPDQNRFQLEGIPLYDPQSGDELVFLPRSMLFGCKGLGNETGAITPVLNLSTRAYEDGKLHAFLEASSPFFLPDGRNGEAELLAYVPLGQKLTIALNGCAMLRDMRPDYGSAGVTRTQMSAYTGAATALLAPSEDILVKARFLRSETQRDIFTPQWIFNQLSTPVRYCTSDLLSFDFIYRKKTFDVRLTLSGSNGFNWIGGRKDADLGLFTGFQPQDTTPPFAELNTANPFGVKGLFYSEGSNPRVKAWTSVSNRAKGELNVKVGDINELRTVLEFTVYNFLLDNSYFGNNDSIFDTYEYSPRYGDFYFADRLHFGNFSIEPGLSLMYLETEQKDTIVGEAGLDISLALTPSVKARASFYGIELEAGSDIAAGLVPFFYFLENAEAKPDADTLLLLPTDPPAPERAFRAWMNATKNLGINWTFGLNLLSSMSYDAPGVELMYDSTNTSFAGISLDTKGVSFAAVPSVRYSSEWVSIKLAYRFSSIQSTSSGVAADYARLLKPDSTAGRLERFPSDSRHKITLVAELTSPSSLPYWAQEWHLSPGFALASGFPDEEVEDVAPWWAWLEITAGRTLTLGRTKTTITAEFLNPFGWQGPLFGSVGRTDPSEEDFRTRAILGNADYHSSRDANHDGYITAAEEVAAYKRARTFYDAWTPGPIPRRSIELKLAFGF